MILEGHYQCPGRAAQQAARLLLNDMGDGVTLQYDGEHRYFSLAQITVSESLGRIPLTLTFQTVAGLCPPMMRHSASGFINAVHRDWCTA